jgi:hypothetical protein
MCSACNMHVLNSGRKRPQRRSNRRGKDNINIDLKVQDVTVLLDSSCSGQGPVAVRREDDNERDLKLNDRDSEKPTVSIFIPEDGDSMSSKRWYLPTNVHGVTTTWRCKTTVFLQEAQSVAHCQGTVRLLHRSGGVVSQPSDETEMLYVKKYFSETFL